MTEEEAKKEAIRLFDAGFNKQLVAVVRSCTAPIFWYPFEGGRAGTPLANGTVFFVDAGAGPLCITARHVLEGYRKASAANVRCQLSKKAWNPLERVISESEDLDIATLRISAEEIASIDCIAHTSPGNWPPKPPEPSKGIFFGGYPGGDREQRGDAISFGFAHALGVAHSPLVKIKSRFSSSGSTGSAKTGNPPHPSDTSGAG